MTRHHVGWVLMIVLLAAGRLARAESLEVHELEAAPERYVNQDLVVVGRFRSATAGEMNLVGSQIVFRVPPRSPAIRSGADAVEVRGRIARDGGRWVFTAEKVSRAPTDREEFTRRRRLLGADNAQGLLTLARWARQRAEWYDDAELRALGEAAVSDALQEQRVRLARAGDAKGLLALAAQAESEGLAVDKINELRHEALALGLRNAKSAETLAALSAETLKFFPQASQPGDGTLPLELDAYLADPAGAYRPLDAGARGKLERLLYTEIVARELDARAAAPRADLAALAARAKRELPDRLDAVARIELAAVRHSASEPGQLARGRLVQLADELRRLGQPAEAQALLRAGLAESRRRLDPDDADGRAELADAYLQLLDDRRSAGDLYLEAWALAPQMPELPERLSQLGYVLQGQRWKPPAGSEPENKPEPPNNPLQPGTSEETVSRMLGRPTRVSRIITGSGVTEQWIYEGPPRLDVYLRRAAGSRSGTVSGVRAP